MRPWTCLAVLAASLLAAGPAAQASSSGSVLVRIANLESRLAALQAKFDAMFAGDNLVVKGNILLNGATAPFGPVAGNIISGPNHAVYGSGNIVFGQNHTVTGNFSVAVGANHTVAASRSAVLAGDLNSITADGSFIGSGSQNQVASVASAVLAGTGNKIDSAASKRSAIVAGESNAIRASRENNIVGAGRGNVVSGNTLDSALAAGEGNAIQNGYAHFIGAGASNSIGPMDWRSGFIGSGDRCRIDGSWAVIGGTFFLDYGFAYPRASFLHTKSGPK
jgi:hypothetical protein